MSEVVRMQCALPNLQGREHSTLSRSRHLHTRMPIYSFVGPSPLRLVGRVASRPHSICGPIRHSTHVFAGPSCCSGKDWTKSAQLQASLTREHGSDASTPSSNGAIQQERLLSFEKTPAALEEDDHDHELPINDSTVHKILAWIFSSVGLLQLAAQLRGKTWNAITISCLMAVALLAAWAGGTQIVHAQVFKQLSTAATAVIYLLAGVPELVDLCFDLTAGHIDTHVLMTLAVFGTLAVGGALEVMISAAF